MIATAHSGVGLRADQVGTGYAPKHDETFYGSFSGAQLTEVKRNASPPPGQVGFSFRASRALSDAQRQAEEAEQLRTSGNGEAVVTNQRVIFRGGLSNREWRLDKLLRIEHLATRPVTLIQVSNRKRISGISYPAEEAPRVRFAIELAASVHFGATAGLIAALQSERSALVNARPAPPPLADPAEAPASRSFGAGVLRLLTGRPGQRPGRRILHTAVAGVVAIGLVNAGAQALAGSGSPQSISAAPPSRSTSAAPAKPSTSANPSPTASSTPVPSRTPTPSPGPTSPLASSTPTETTTTPATTPPPPPTPTPTPTIKPDKVIKKFKAGSKPRPPRLLPTKGTSSVRIGAICRDGSYSDATGRGACSWHKGVKEWLYEEPSWVEKNKAKNAKLKKAYKAKLKTWNDLTKKNQLLTKYPCSKGPYQKGSPGYATWRDTNHNGIACDR
ncbi:MAG: hypothetical protein QM804_04140 [Propionicimonas sp.]